MKKSPRRPNTATQTRQSALAKSSRIITSSTPTAQPSPTPSLTLTPSQQPQPQPHPWPLSTHPHSTPTKSYRIPSQSVYTYLRNSIYQTFQKKTSRQYKLMKELTGDANHHAIDRLCQKFSILRVHKRNMFEDVEVNVEEITKRYVLSKSKQKQREQNTARLKSDITKNYRYGYKNQYSKSQQFFSLDGSQLKNLQRKHQQKYRYSKHDNGCNTYRSTINETGVDPVDPSLRRSHPYVRLYEEGQKQTINSFRKQEMCEVEEYAPLFQPDEWERNKKAVEKMVEENKEKKRVIQCARAKKAPKLDFFLT